jgi:hypothetical protein
MNPQPKILHCTVKFIGKTTDQSRQDYMNYAANRLVSHLLGKMCRGYIVGFVITPRTLGKSIDEYSIKIIGLFLGARLLFPDRHTWALWAQDDNEVSSKQPPSSSRASSGDNNKKQSSNRRNNKSKRITTTDDFVTTDDYSTSMVRSITDDDALLVDKILSSNESEQVSFLHPTFGFLSRAHLTCGVAPGISAAQTGHDMVEMIQKESDSILRNLSLPESNDERTVMKYFGNGNCIIYLKEPIPIGTIFSGFFH